MAEVTPDNSSLNNSSLRIGDLARLCGISVRMLRHYHEIGLLEPGHVDATTGYRSYGKAQHERLVQILQIRDLGFSLADTKELLSAELSGHRLNELLETHKARLEQEISVTSDRLQRTQDVLDMANPTMSMNQRLDRLTSIGAAMNEKEAPQIVVEVKSTPSKWVAQVSGVADSWAPSEIGTVISPLYPRLEMLMQNAGLKSSGTSMAWYDDTTDGRVSVNATLEIEPPDVPTEPTTTPASDSELQIVELAGLPRAATTLHRGPMSDCGDTYAALIDWISANGHKIDGHGRELDIECGPDGPLLTEIQIPIR